MLRVIFGLMVEVEVIVFVVPVALLHGVVEAVIVMAEVAVIVVIVRVY